MAYNSLEQLKGREAAFGGLGRLHYKIEAVDRDSPMTLVTLVGGNIVPGIECITRNAADQIGANLYVFGSADHLNQEDAQRLRIHPENFVDAKLTNMLSKSSGLLLADATDARALIYVTGQNTELVNELGYAIPRTLARVSRTNNAGANHPNHVVNRYTRSGGAEVALGSGIRAEREDRINSRADIIAQAVSNYLNNQTPDDRHESVRPSNPTESWAHDVKREVRESLPPALRNLRRRR